MVSVARRLEQILTMLIMLLIFAVTSFSRPKARANPDFKD